MRKASWLGPLDAAAATKVKTVVSNIITIFLWSLVALTVIAAVVAGLHFVALGVPGSSTLSQMNSDHLEVPISHYEAFPWITWILFKATERLALVWQYYNLWLGYIFYFIKINARIALTLFGIYFFRRDLVRAARMSFRFCTRSYDRFDRSQPAPSVRAVWSAPYNPSLGSRTRSHG